MNSKNKRYLVIAFIVLAILILFFSNELGIRGKMNGIMNEHLSIGEISFSWFPTLLAYGLGVLTGWIIFRKKGLL